MHEDAVVFNVCERPGDLKNIMIVVPAILVASALTSLIWVSVDVGLVVIQDHFTHTLLSGFRTSFNSIELIRILYIKIDIRPSLKLGSTRFIPLFS
jgi:hypothetical protein